MPIEHYDDRYKNKKIFQQNFAVKNDNINKKYDLNKSH